MTDDTDYSQHPQSLNEIKAQREQDGRLWTPRDALIDLLRDIDAGRVNVDDIVIVRRGPTGEDGQMETRYTIAGKSGFTISVGMLQIALHTLLGKLQ